LKLFYAGVEVRRRYIRVGKAGAFIDRMDKMRAVALRMEAHSGIERRSHDGQSIIRAELKVVASPRFVTRACHDTT
jgi:hypothetical protein